MLFITLQVFPAAMQSDGIDLVTMLPLPIILRAPIVTPFNMTQRVPINTSSSITIGAVLAVNTSLDILPILSLDPLIR